MNRATYTKPGFPPVAVKNLGWLLRRAGQVQTLYFHLPKPREECGGVFSALLGDGTMYSTPYASIEVCWGFVNRPSWQGVRFQVNGAAIVIGSSEFKHIAALEWGAMRKEIVASVAL